MKKFWRTLITLHIGGFDEGYTGKAAINTRF